MKKTLTLLLIMTLAFILASCGASTITGEPATFENKDGSVSIDIPAENEKSWIINEETSGDILDITDKADTINVVLQCVSKTQMTPVAKDLLEYEEYVTANTFAAYFDDINPKTTHIDPPEYMKLYNAYTYTGPDTEGIIAFMESDKCYYTYIVRTVEDGYSTNKKVLNDSLFSIKELTAVK
ncbi:MAG: hypothetical protein IJC23_06805 [Bacteroidaceae bacterium]|nr:hypothetical protein [Bacteroidaceae bacterium]